MIYLKNEGWDIIRVPWKYFYNNTKEVIQNLKYFINNVDL